MHEIYFEVAREGTVKNFSHTDGISWELMQILFM